MARNPRKEGRSKKRGKKSASGRRSAPKRPQKHARKVASKVAKPARRKRRSSSAYSATLARELKEAQARLAATAEILKIIASSPSDAKPVFNAIVKSAVDLCGARFGAVFRMEGRLLHLVADQSFGRKQRQLLGAMYPMVPNRGHISGRAILDGAVVQIPDIYVDEHYKSMEAKKAGFRSLLATPLLHGSKAIGSIVIYRTEPGAFTENQSALLQSFAAQAVIAIENTRLFNETKEALARQTATSEVLQVISSSPGDLKPVFEQMLAKAMRLCEAQSGFIYQGEQGAMRAVAEIGVPRAFAEYRRQHLHTGGAATPIDAMRATRKSAHVHDARDSEPYRSGNPNAVAGVDLGGARTVLYVPMIRNDDIVGVINLYRQEVRPFTDEQIALLENFASQAVIAIENARLFNETKEALERQTATSDILKVIASSPDDVQPVFQAIAERSNQLLNGLSTAVYSLVDDMQHLMAFTPIDAAADAALKSMFPRPLSETFWSEAVLQGEIFRITDAETELATLPAVRDVARLRGWRGALIVPLVRDRKSIGLISVTRVEPGSFADHHVELLRTFADQAVIAIQNTRLFNETKEALARQTATADVLKVIASSPSNLQPVFDAIAERSKALIGAHSTTVVRYIGGMAELAAYTPVGPEADAALRAFFPQPIAVIPQSDLVEGGMTAQITDAESDIYPAALRNMAQARGWRSRLMVPLKDDTGPIGFISVARQELGAFADKHVELLQTFADQAVIAIQNVELFQQVQAKTRDLEESLQQQTATADVLKVISRSAFDLDTVMDTLTRSARHLCGADGGALFLRNGDMLMCRGVEAVRPADEEFMKANPVPLNDESHMGHAVLTGTIVNIGDIEHKLKLRKFQQSSGFKAFLAVPLMREGQGVGVLTLIRFQVGEFTQRQVELVQTFADQAVIAIENTRLFNETTQALEQQTATADILKVIAGSPDDVQPVFQAIADRSNRLVNGFATTVVSIADDMVHLSAFTPTHSAADAALKSFYPQPLSTFTYSEAIRQGKIHRVVDAEVEVADQPASLEMIRRRGWRSALWVPLLRDGKAIGVIGATRVEPGPFADHHVQLLQTFADQAVIAISNVELFRQVQQRTRELSQSLDDLRAAQDRLVQTEKLASLGQLTAGIAHEIKNPLNFVNNFSALSVELTDELNDVLKQAQLADKLQQDVNELTQLLKSNLEKVVQHGKRADSIVKNMLLHSREGSGEQRAADINALVEESLNLAYHGARAEKSGFNITLERQFDASAGEAELFPQEITRALLNLISNGFYAATRRKAENGEAAFEPTLLATTKDRGTSVEIRIRDNGTGIPPEVKEKMFNPFFTTKPAGEGTGLGLSMTHDIIVKQHGGTIDVATEPGNFTEFIVVLPRANNAHGRSRGQA
jgi:two-component system NtrC family sensor kinase